MKMTKFVSVLFFQICLGMAQAQITFVDQTLSSGLGGNALNQGLALADYDLDGFEDLYVTALNGGPNRLYRNMGNFIFQDVSAIAGVGYSGTSKISCWGDIDNDGDPDLYVGNRDEKDILYINRGDGTFEDQTISRGISNAHNVSSVIMADINRDGWLDIYIGNIHQPNVMYLNDGTGHFNDYTLASGATDQAVAMGSVFFDFDLDGDADLYLTHDAMVPYILFENMGNGQFNNISAAAKVNYAGFGMGVDIGDFNLDGYPDMYITNLYSNVLFKNNGDGTFEDVTEAYGVGDAGMGWGNVWADFDNDRLPDLYVSNDTYFSPYPNVLYHNTGSGFEIVSEEDPCSSPFGGYATVAADLNHDGLLDLLVANSGSPGVQLFQNTTAGDYHYISFHLEGVESNRDAIGARIEVHTGAGVQYDQVIGNSGYAAHNGRWVHFGLNNETVVERVIIHWPSRAVQEIEDLSGNQRYRIREGEGVITSASDIRFEIRECKMTGGTKEYAIQVQSDQYVKSIYVTDLIGRSIPVSYTYSQDQVKIVLPLLSAGIYQFSVIQSDAICASKIFVSDH